MNRKMNVKSEPFVSIVTPAYNGEDYLAECIESVLAQKYKNWEYIIVDNYSTDRTLEIAQNFAYEDSRIHVYTNDEFVSVFENHNRALRLISADSKYCKVVSADDWIYPECIDKMVEVAEQYPSVGIVGSYQLCGKTVKFHGLDVSETVIDGRKVCKSDLLDGPYVIGAPTSVLYRSSLVHKNKDFFPNPTSVHSDMSACYHYLKDTDFGFVHQVLSYARIHEKTMSSASAKINMQIAARFYDLITYGPYYLNEKEMDVFFKKKMNDYYDFLAENIGQYKYNKTFWDYHKDHLSKLGHPLNKKMLLEKVLKRAIKLSVKPHQAYKKILRLIWS